ncbi:MULTISPECIES: iron ABC transporter substrate-binding protein [Arthrobacter]|uniref:Iron ABC transporter substrate-binding protein n=1 Tax=Arthrobacter terricola TaxID=2547396 RepID=A0A4R5KG04_9MICC|nr:MULTISPECIES: iron ABC transporter substrate-binding protein [Arthrobacter]MBT8161871.1 iron ABC transporter substrate-binding protein [Arthrobacter sp. GN70]TDF94253.1 iron ABC transporter substrate-binding protein [Arthrobacter terricola]
MKFGFKTATTIAVASASLLALSACSGGSASTSGSASGAPAAGGDSIVVYNAQHENLTGAWVAAFTNATGIKVTLRNGDDLEMSNQLSEEGKNSPADVFLTENSPAMVRIANSGLLAPVDKATLDQVPSQYRPSTGNWTGIAARSTVLAYNKNKLSADQLPKSLMDLADPAWKGRIGASTGGADFQAIVSAMLELKGQDATEKWLEAAKTNFKSYKDDTPVLAGVNAGEVDAGVLYHYYSFVDQAQTGENSKNVSLYYFKNQDPGAFVSVSGGAVLASSKKQAEAQEFLKFITGKEGQQVLQTGDSFEYTVGSDVPANPKLVPLKDLQAPSIDPAKLNSDKVTELMTQAGLL